jgi:hypothetical protein
MIGIRRWYRRREFLRIMQDARLQRAAQTKRLIDSIVFREGKYCVFRVSPWWYVGEVDEPGRAVERFPGRVIDRFALSTSAIKCAKMYANAP